MAVGGELFVAGQYTVTWNSLALGLHEGEGGVPTITWQDHSDPIAKTDRYGRAKIDGIRMGVDYQYECILMEYSKALALLAGYFGTLGLQGLVGILKYSLAKPLVLTAIAGTTASAAPATLTATNAVLADEHQGKLLYGPQLRTCPLKMDLLPYLVSTVVTNFTMT